MSAARAERAGASEPPARVALVTGGSRGIGKEICLALAVSGAAVAVNYRAGAEAAATVVEAIVAAGGRAQAFQTDIGAPDEIPAMFRTIEAELGPIDILVNNAGVVRDALLLRMS